jgi:hypothetical protein
MTVLERASSNLTDRPVELVSCEIGTSQQGPDPWNPEAEDTVGTSWQATPSEDIEGLVCAIVRSKVCELAIAL